MPRADFNPSLYLLTDAAQRSDAAIVAGVQQALRGGVSAVQLRDKSRRSIDLLPLAQRLEALTAAYGAAFIVNDYLDLALAAQADGLHMGQEDGDICSVREKLGRGKLLGVSVGSVEEALRAEQGGADYLGVGDLFGSRSKRGTGRPVGLATLRQIRQAVRLPLVGIGGVSQESAATVMAAGADGVAVISALWQAADMTAAASALRREITPFACEPRWR